MLRVAFYKSTPHGITGVYNYLVRAWERGPYSHCELIFSDGQAASASFMDGGVRFKQIDFVPERWDIFELPAHLEPAARAWFESSEGLKYDVLGNLHFVIGFVPESRSRVFCSEAVAAALGIDEAWRLGPNALATILRWHCRQARLLLDLPTGKL